MKKKNIIIIIGAVILIALIATITIMLLKNNSSKDLEPDEPKEFDNKTLVSLIASIDVVNSYLTEENLSEESSYEKDEAMCYKYTGPDTYAFQKLLESTFRNAFKKESAFNLVTVDKGENTTSEEIFVCVPYGCNIGKVEKYNVIKESEKEDFKEIIMNSIYIGTASRKNNEWKWDDPILVCKQNQAEN